MLHRDYDRKVSVEKTSLVVSVKGLDCAGDVSSNLLGWIGIKVNISGGPAKSKGAGEQAMMPTEAMSPVESRKLE
jgi:hypothetical protein